VKNVEEVFNLT